MAMIQVGERFFYGAGLLKPRLPAGWKYIESRREWLIAESPKGDQYFVTAEALYPRRTATWKDVARTLPNLLRGGKPMKIGRAFVDMRVRLPIKEIWNETNNR